MPRTQPQFWQTRGPYAYALWPFSLLYRAGASIHRRCRMHRCYWAGVPVISVGNITLGGAGKTPLVHYLADYFAGQGEQVAILSRGYGSQNSMPYQVTATDGAEAVGDEPLMLFHALAHTSAQVWVGSNRADVARRAEQAGATLLILDDGFQHHQLARNANIVVVDGISKFGNGLCLPAGPLREPMCSLKRANFMVIMNSIETLPSYWQQTAYRVQTKLKRSDIKTLKGQPLIAFAGLAKPEKFFTSLTKEGLKMVSTYPFPDHHSFSEKDLSTLQQAAQKAGATLVTTAKDAVKLPANFPVTVIHQELFGADLTNICEELRTLLR